MAHVVRELGGSGSFVEADVFEDHLRETRPIATGYISVSGVGGDNPVMRVFDKDGKDLYVHHFTANTTYWRATVPGAIFWDEFEVHKGVRTVTNRVVLKFRTNLLSRPLWSEIIRVRDSPNIDILTQICEHPYDVPLVPREWVYLEAMVQDIEQVMYGPDAGNPATRLTVLNLINDLCSEALHVSWRWGVELDYKFLREELRIVGLFPAPPNMTIIRNVHFFRVKNLLKRFLKFLKQP